MPILWELLENGKNTEIRKIYDNFRFSVQILAKIYHKLFGF